jgi:hypothetical protein
MKLRLQISLSPASSTSFEYTGSTMRIGRDPEVELVLEGDACQTVSWRHAEIELTPKGAYLSDLKSSNGTLVNGKRISDRALLKVGDQIRLGHTGPLLEVAQLELVDATQEQFAMQPLPDEGFSADLLDAPSESAKKDPRDATYMDIPPPPPSPKAPPPSEKLSTGGVEEALRRTQRNMLIAVAVVALGLLLVAGLVLFRSKERAPSVPPPDPKPTPATPDEARLAPASVPEKPPDKAPLPRETALAAAQNPATEAKAPQPQEPTSSAPTAEHREVGNFVSPGKPPTVLVQRQRGSEPWGRLRTGDRVFTANYLVSLPGYRSKLFLDGGVRMMLWGNVPEFSESPVLESRVMLNVPPPGIDLDFTLDRGRVHLLNYKTSAEARVRVRFFQEVWDLTLPDSKTEAVVELWGAQPDVPFRKEPGGRTPLACLGLFIKGQARLTAQNKEVNLPDLSYVSWSNINPIPTGPRTLQQAPAWWTDKIDSQETQRGNVLVALADFSQELAKSDAVLDTIVTKAKEFEYAPHRSVGVMFLGALDALPQLLDALEDRQYAEVRGTAAFTLWHWVNRAGDNELELIRILRESKGYSKEKAETFRRLLHSLSERELADPRTYETLVGYLDHDNLAIRELAIWHLSLLAPDGARSIPYDPVAESDKRQQAVQQWKRLIADGKLPAKSARPQGHN